jgi:hypothetical protein
MAHHILNTIRKYCTNSQFALQLKQHYEKLFPAISKKYPTRVIFTGALFMKHIGLTGYKTTTLSQVRNTFNKSTKVFSSSQLSELCLSRIS